MLKEREDERLKQLGNQALAQNKPAKAVVFYSQAMALAPSHIYASNRSLAYLQLGQFEKALQDAQEAVKLCPEYPKGYFRGATALRELDRPEEALDLARRGLALDPALLQDLCNELEEECRGRGSPE